MTRLKNKQIDWSTQINLSGQSIVNLGAPVDETSPIRRLEADNSNFKQSVLVATKSNSNWTTSVSLSFSNPTLTISGLTAGLSRGKIDGVEPIVNDRILIKDAGSASAGSANTPAFNGIWRVTGGTPMTLTLVRDTDSNTAEKLNSAIVSVRVGSFAQFLFMESSAISILNSDPVVWTPISGGGGSSVLNNFTATTNPGASDDETQGYSVGSQWVNTVSGEGFICTDASAGFANWASTTATGEGSLTLPGGWTAEVVDELPVGVFLDVTDTASNVYRVELSFKTPPPVSDPDFTMDFESGW